jgi:cysteine-rich repeat protein
VQSAKIDWRVRGGSFTQLGMSVDGSTYAATLPTQLDGAVLEYSVTVELSDGGHVRFPDNAADYYYQAYVGEVSRLWCADFEGGFAGWTHSTTPSEADEWEVGTPAGRGGDPSSAHGGVGALGIDLTHDGQYAAEMTTAVESPTIDLAGHTTGVHLQYYRWLRAEDGFFDRSTVRANGAEIWRSFASFRSADAQVHHLDKEWRFHDLDVSAQAAAGTIKLQFGLTSDGGLQAGGWTIDDVCLVVPAPPGPACGNGTVETGESCDDGNTTAGDGCAASCQTEPAGGDGGGGCSSTSSAPTGGSALGLLALGLIMPSARRRRHGGTGAPGTGRRPHRRGWRRPPHVLARDPASADTRAPCS